VVVAVIFCEFSFKAVCAREYVSSEVLITVFGKLGAVKCKLLQPKKFQFLNC